MTAALTYPTTTWTRTKTGLIAGVCEGVARRLNVEVWLVRFIWVMTVLLMGTGLFAYLVLAIALPREDKIDRAYERMIFGVCSRIARRSDIEIGIVRAAAVLSACVTFGVSLVAYLLLYVLLPEPTPRPE
ncbi:MAG: PspC domain-containing protein [Bdellovibrionaceae bacterium]|nr:PspC domain-containing protein [Pseudobdellovibrionaceae bacterium]